jgi:hypothetical protein
LPSVALFSRFCLVQACTIWLRPGSLVFEREGLMVFPFLRASAAASSSCIQRERWFAPDAVTTRFLMLWSASAGWCSAKV